MTVGALVLGAGHGARLRESLPEDAARRAPPKALVQLLGRTLLARSIAALCAAPSLATVVPVLPAEALGAFEGVRREAGSPPSLAAAVAGGAERQDSARAGLRALPPHVTHVAVHDAARPLVRPEDVERVIAVALDTGAALLAVPLRDTVHRVRAGLLAETPPREECWAAQTPQVFRRDWLEEALAKADAEGVVGTDDAALVRRLGVDVHVVPGDPANLKITTAADLAAAEAWLRQAGGR